MVFAFLNLHAQQKFIAAFGLGSSTGAPLSHSYILENGNIVALAFEPTNQQISFTTINEEGLIIDQKIHYFPLSSNRILVQTNSNIFVLGMQEWNGFLVKIERFELDGTYISPNLNFGTQEIYSMKNCFELSNGNFLLFGNCFDYSATDCGDNQCLKNCLTLLDENMAFISTKLYGNDGAFYNPILMHEVDNGEIILLSNVMQYSPPKNSAQVQKINANMELVWEEAFPEIPDASTTITTFEDDVIISYPTTDSLENSTNYIEYHVIDVNGESKFSNEITNDYINSYKNASVLTGLNNGQLWITGDYEQNNNRDVFLMKSSFSNQTHCFNTFNVPNNIASINHILKLPDGGVVLTGGSHLNGLVIRTDSDCNAYPLNTNNAYRTSQIPYAYHSGNGILQFTLPESYYTINYALYNLNGQLLTTDKAHNNDRVSIEDLPTGFYLITLNDGKGNHWSQKIVKP